jgi:hypothetical protein
MTTTVASARAPRLEVKEVVAFVLFFFAVIADPPIVRAGGITELIQRTGNARLFERHTRVAAFNGDG